MSDSAPSSVSRKINRSICTGDFDLSKALDFSLCRKISVYRTRAARTLRNMILLFDRFNVGIEINIVLDRHRSPIQTILERVNKFYSSFVVFLFRFIDCSWDNGNRDEWKQIFEATDDNYATDISSIKFYHFIKILFHCFTLLSEISLFYFIFKSIGSSFHQRIERRD